MKQTWDLCKKEGKPPEELRCIAFFPAKKTSWKPSNTTCAGSVLKAKRQKPITPTTIFHFHIQHTQQRISNRRGKAECSNGRIERMLGWRAIARGRGAMLRSISRAPKTILSGLENHGKFPSQHGQPDIKMKKTSTTRFRSKKKNKKKPAAATKTEPKHTLGLVVPTPTSPDNNNNNPTSDAVCAPGRSFPPWIAKLLPSQINGIFVLEQGPSYKPTDSCQSFGFWFGKKTTKITASTPEFSFPSPASILRQPLVPKPKWDFSGFGGASAGREKNQYCISRHQCNATISGVVQRGRRACLPISLA